MKVAVLGREDIKKILSMDRVISGVEGVYRMKAQGETVVWPLVSYDFMKDDVKTGVMDIRSGYVKGAGLHGMKMLNNFPGNAQKELPSFNGMLLIFDSETGIPLGVMDASYVTCMRTGAAGALGAKYLARKNSKNLMILGAGKQAAYQIAAALLLMPQLEKVYITDPLAAQNARAFAEDIPQRLLKEFGINAVGTTVFIPESSLEKAVGDSDIIITVTPSREAVIQKEWVKPGTHFSCIGADMEGKEELDPRIFAGAKIFADDKPQCLRVGEMEIPFKKGIICEGDIAGELGQLIDGQLEGRTSEEQITIFDATGLALLDLVTGKIAIDLALAKGVGLAADI